MRTVAVLEGWAGGPKLSRRFTKELLANGFSLTKKITEADIIFAHSTGCYMLPADVKARRIYLLDPPYWPGRAITGRWLDLMRTDRSLLLSGGSLGGFAVKKLWEIYYVFAKPRYTWSVFRNQSHLDFLERLSDKDLVIIRNQNDEFCAPKIKEALKSRKNVSYIELPGNHEDYYVNPKPYIDLLLKELK